MSLLLDALKRAEQAKRQQAAAGQVYPPLALQDEAQAAATPAPAAADVVPPVVPESPVESAFAAGLALEPVDHSPASTELVDRDVSVPSPIGDSPAALADPAPAPEPVREPVPAPAPNVVEHAAAKLAGGEENDANPAPVAPTPADTNRPLSSSPLASRFGAATKAPAPESAAVPERNDAPAESTAAVGANTAAEIKLAAKPAPTPEAAQRVMANKPARKPVNRSVLLALCGLLLVGASAGYLWWQMQPPAYVPANDPLAGNMADAGAAANTAAAPADVQPLPANVKSALAPASAPPSTPPKSAKGAGSTPVAIATAPATATRSGKQLEIRHDAPEEAVDATLQEGYRAYQAGDFASARAAYVRALQSNYRSRDALLGMAAIAVRQGRPEEAERFYRKQLEFDPLDEVAKAGLTGIARGMGTRERETALRNLGEAPASNAQTAVQLGNLYASEKRWADAQQQYFRALTLEPGNPDHAFNLAVSLEHLDQPKLALDYYQKAQTLAAQRKPAFDPAELKTRIEALSQP